ncbi:MAG: hypothetical protein V3W41_09235 [Planctomycetota bacterium]
MKANKVRAALEKVKGMKTVVVDSTATAWMKTTDDKKPSREAISAALKPLRSSISTLEKVTQPKPAVVYKLVVDGVG